MNDELQNHLLAELTPVRPCNPWRRIGIWVLFALAYVGAILALRGLRPDLAYELTHLSYGLEIGLTGLLAVIAGAAAMLSAIPGERPRLLSISATIGAGGIGALVISAGLQLSMPDWRLVLDTGHARVTALLVAFALPPALLLLCQIRRLAPTRLRRTCALIGVAATAVSYLILRLSLQDDTILHVLLWCYLPMIALIGGFYLLGRRLLRW